MFGERASEGGGFCQNFETVRTRTTPDALFGTEPFDGTERQSIEILFLDYSATKISLQHQQQRWQMAIQLFQHEPS
jgi:hypothetical protein